MTTKTIDDISLAGKKVLVRVDFNVPMTPDLKVSDDKRIVESLPTIKKILSSGGAVVLMSHLGRPDGQVAPEFSLRPTSARLSEMLKKPVAFATDTVGPDAQANHHDPFGAPGHEPEAGRRCNNWLDGRHPCRDRVTRRPSDRRGLRGQSTDLTLEPGPRGWLLRGRWIPLSTLNTDQSRSPDPTR